MASLFGDVKVAEEGKFVITVDGNVVQLDGWSGDVFAKVLDPVY